MQGLGWPVQVQGLALELTLVRLRWLCRSRVHNSGIPGGGGIGGNGIPGGGGISVPFLLFT